jgi:hypothetical protein
MVLGIATTCKLKAQNRRFSWQATLDVFERMDDKEIVVFAYNFFPSKCALSPLLLLENKLLTLCGYSVRNFFLKNINSFFFWLFR